MDAKGDCHLLFVPVRESGSGMLALRTGRLPSGQRVGLAFTSAASYPFAFACATSSRGVRPVFSSILSKYA